MKSLTFWSLYIKSRVNNELRRKIRRKNNEERKIKSRLHGYKSSREIKQGKPKEKVDRLFAILDIQEKLLGKSDS